MSEIRDRSFPVDLVTPEGQLFSGSATFVVIPSHDGEMGFAFLRSPVMSSLSEGEMRVTLASSGKVERFIVQGGFAGTDGEKLVVLASRAQRVDAYEIEAVNERLKRLNDQIEASEKDDPELPFLKEEQTWVSLVQSVVKRVIRLSNR